MELDLEIGLPPDTFFACYPETLLLTLAGGDGPDFVGRATVENAEYLAGLGEKFGLEPRLVRR